VTRVQLVGLVLVNISVVGTAAILAVTDWLLLTT
jgi:hypothetical protein